MKFQQRWRLAQVLALGMTLAGCGNMPNVSDLSQVKLVPDARTFMPSNSNTYTAAQTARILRPIVPSDLVDGQGVCSGMFPASSIAAGAEAAQMSPPVMAAPARGVALEMTECEVASALGTPQRAEIGSNERGERSVTLTYFSPERSGFYRFVDGRLVSIERGPEPPAPPPSAKKAVKKKTAPAKKTPDAKPPNA